MKKLPYYPRPNRKASKRQVTVRIDTYLMRILEAQNEGTGMTVTEILEECLWHWIEDRPERAQVRNPRWVWRLLPPEMRGLTLSMVTWMMGSEDAPFPDKLFRRFTRKLLEHYTNQPDFREQYRTLVQQYSEDEARNRLGEDEARKRGLIA